MPKATFNPIISALTVPPIPLVQQWANSYDGGYGPLLDLSQAVPGYDAHPKLLELLSKTAGQQKYTDYGPIEGELDLRTSYSAHMSNLYGADLTKDNTHITSGCNQAFVSAVMAVAGHGDSILVANPFYFNHETTLEMLGIKVKCYKTDVNNSFLPDLTSLEDGISNGVKAVVLVSPNNPTGTICPPDFLNRVFQLCQENGIWLIVDETYRDFLPLHMDRPHDLFQIPGWQDNLIQLYSFSKSFRIPGHRLGAVAGGTKLIKNVAKVMDNLQICAPRAPQGAVAATFELLEGWRHENRVEIAARAETMTSVFETIPNWNVEAIGAYFAYVKHPFTDVSSIKVAENLATKRGVVCIPGSFFGAGQDNYLRIAFANADQSNIRLLSDRLKGFELS
jgi:aspartate/methionine/tyrosine aminotransferase